MQTLKNLAIHTRELFEARQIDLHRLSALYNEYKHIEDVEEFIALGMRDFSRFCCGLACVYIRASLGFGSIFYGKYRAYPHSFLLINNKIVIDITADQFGGPEVYVGPLKFPWSIDGDKRTIGLRRKDNGKPESSEYPVRAGS